MSSAEPEEIEEPLEEEVFDGGVYDAEPEDVPREVNGAQDDMADTEEPE